MAKLKMGRIVWTREVNDKIADDEAFAKFVLACMARHGNGDWGEMEPDDIEANNQALVDGGRILSAYVKEGLTKIWIITEWDRSVTTVLFPHEY